MVLSIKRFEGKVAIVTGASAGIGAAIAEELVKNGLIVAGLGRRIERIDALAQNLSKEKGKLHAFKCDLTNEDQLVSTIKRIINELGPVHILVNNAGLSLQDSLITGDTQTWRTILDTNVIGLNIATREVVQNMKASKTEGHIININSVLGHQVEDFPGISMYTASKYAVTALSEVLRNEVNREKLPIKITSISPGYVKTEFLKAAGYEAVDLPIPGLASKDIAKAVIYAVSTPPSVNVTELTVKAISN